MKKVFQYIKPNTRFTCARNWISTTRMQQNETHAQKTEIEHEIQREETDKIEHEIQREDVEMVEEVQDPLVQYFNLPPEELRELIVRRCEEIVAPLLSIQPPVSGLRLGTMKIKFDVVKALSEEFGIGMPSSVLCKIQTVEDIENFIVEHIQSVEPQIPIDVPENVHLFIYNYQKKRERRVRERMVKIIADRKKRHLKDIIERNWGAPRGELTEGELKTYLKTVRKQVDQELFGKKFRKRTARRRGEEPKYPRYDKKWPRETYDSFLGKIKAVQQQRDHL